MEAHSSGLGWVVSAEPICDSDCRRWWDGRRACCRRGSPELLVCACLLLWRDGTVGDVSAPEGWRLLGRAVVVGLMV
jgi:hypothetical protein